MPEITVSVQAEPVRSVAELEGYFPLAALEEGGTACDRPARIRSPVHSRLLAGSSSLPADAGEAGNDEARVGRGAPLREMHQAGFHQVGAVEAAGDLVTRARSDPGGPHLPVQL
jgi:hypothetical protein